MRVPQVNERVKEAPAQALRAVFASIGQLLLVTDRLRNRTPDGAPATLEAAAPSVPAPAPAPEAEAAASAPAAASAAAAAAAEAVAPPATAPADTAPEPPAPAGATAPDVATPTASAPATSAPLPNYDELTVPSLRARMRTLSADQLTSLIAYEQTHVNRPEVIAMFERRIAKLAEG